MDIATSSRGHEEAGQKQYKVSHWKLADFFPLCFSTLLKLKTSRILSCVSPELTHFNTVGLVRPLFSAARVSFSLQIGD